MTNPSFSQPQARKQLLTPSLLLLILVVSVFPFFAGLENMLFYWEREEYSHSYLIPLIALFLAVKKLPELSETTPKQQWFGLIILVFSLFLLVLGELSALFAIIQYGYVVALLGCVIAFIGLNGAGKIWVALAYLFFMVPLPNFLYDNLSGQLQLISSELGVMVVRAFGISVFLEGNVIDLGAMKLQVVDACSGLRYLFPLLSFGFLIAALYKAPLWQRAIIFLSAIPITVLMNSFRIGVIGITVEYFGISAAEGFLHDFEGWIVFIACLAVMFGEIALLKKITRLEGSVVDRIDLSLPSPLFSSRYFKAAGKVGPSSIIALLVILASIPLSNLINEREENIPERIQFANMPLFQGHWMGTESNLEADVLGELKLSDYFIADYKNLESGNRLNLYAAYYNSQRKGASIHSPRSCLPGGGWKISEFSKKRVEGIPLSSKGNFSVNRALIEKGDSKLLVYYWFKQRGRIITNEFLAKWFIFWDALTLNRTDGALIRVTTALPDGMTVDEADTMLEEFIIEFNPILDQYIPD